MTIESLYYTVPEVAALIRVSIPTVYRWIAQDTTFPALKLAGAVRVNRTRLHKWLHDREQGRPRPRQGDKLLPHGSQSAVNAKEGK
jgi:excisionase family DNA binding protein